MSEAQETPRAPTKVPLSSRVVVENPWLCLRTDDFRRGDGSVGEFSVVTKSDFVVVVCHVDGPLLMIEQYRYAAAEWSLELPQGGLADGESPTNAALRELREETGWIGTDPILLGEKLYEAADWATQHFRVVAVRPVRHVETCLDRDEQDTRNRLVAWSDLPVLIARGEIIDATTLAGLFVYGLSEQGRNTWPF